MTIQHTFTLRLDIDGHLPNLHPSTIAWVRKARAGKLQGVGWKRQMRDELEAMIAEIEVERKRAREAVGTVKRKSRYYD
jgi:hypothetical protein